MSAQRQALITLIKDLGCEEHDDPVKLAGGDESNIYLDIPRTLGYGRRLRLAAAAIGEWIDLHVTVPVTAIGGPALGSISLSTAVAMRNLNLKWFTVRPVLKDHGIPKLIEGADLGEGDSVILTDDVVNTGESLLHAYEVVCETGATVLAVVPLVDRAGLAQARFEALDVDYWPVITYLDLNLDPIIQSSGV